MFCLHSIKNIIKDIYNFLMNLIAAISAYCFFENKPEAIKGYCVEDNKQITLF